MPLFPSSNNQGNSALNIRIDFNLVNLQTDFTYSKYTHKCTVELTRHGTDKLEKPQFRQGQCRLNLEKNFQMKEHTENTRQMILDLMFNSIFASKTNTT